MARSRFPKHLATVAVLAVIYFLAAKLGLRLAFVNASATAVWPPSGIALAALLLLGYRVWPGIFLGAFLANLATAGSVATSIAIATGNTLEGLLGAYLVCRFAHGRKAFDRAGDVFVFAFLAGMVSTMVSATFGVTSLALGGYAEWNQYGDVWWTWWLGDAAGALVVAPFLVLWGSDARLKWTRRQIVERTLFLLGLFLVDQTVFGSAIPAVIKHYPLEFLCIPFLVWSAFRFGQREAITAVVLTASIAIWGTLHGFGPFVLETQNRSLLLLQAFMGVISAMTVALAAVVAERKQAEQALRGSQRGLELEVQERTRDLLTTAEALEIDIAKRHRVEEEAERFFNLSLDMLCIAGFDGRFKCLNPAWEKILGFGREELLARPCAEFVHPDDREAALAEAKKLLAAGHEAARFESRCLAKDGSYRWLLWNATVLREQELVYAAARDITERKQAEDALRESEERFRLLVAGVQDYAIFRLDTEGHVRSWNAGAENITGYKAREVIGKHFSIFFPPEDIATGRARQLLEKVRSQDRCEDESWRVRKDGSRFLANAVITALRDDHGNLRGFAKVIRDITERKRAEQALQEAAALESRTTQIALLSQMGRLLQTCLTAQEAYRVIAQSAPRLFMRESGAFFVLSESKHLVEEVAAWGDSSSGDSLFSREDCWALRSGRIHFVDDPASAMLCPHVGQSAASPYMCIPMVAQGDALGILYLRSSSQQSPFSPEEARRLLVSKQELAIAVAEQVGLALANLKLRETLRTQSIRDPLSGLYNRRHMEEAMERELRRASRNGGPLGVVVLDLDHFKDYNDSFGHEAGDNLLREFSSLLLTEVRGQDIACRFGGEEFVIILPDASLETSISCAERLREQVKHMNVHYRGRSLGSITMSLGVAVFPEHAVAADALLRAADEALLRAKQGGRDRVGVAETRAKAAGGPTN